MTDEQGRQVDSIIAALERHPRIQFQELVTSPEHLAALRSTLPRLVPFGNHRYNAFLPILDWDHRLPSRQAVLRIYAYYSPLTRAAGQEEFHLRREQIVAGDQFPEFDVPDFAGLTADESYESEVTPATGEVTQTRLVSNWRREVSHTDARISVQVARKSEEFRQLQLSFRSRRRPDYLGDLEAVSWTPPCESAHDGWTIDVWYLTDLDAAVGKGRSFLVDLSSKRVIGVREFVVRSG